MFAKLFVVLSLFAAISRGHPHHHDDPDAHYVQEICSSKTDPTCAATVEKCMFNTTSSPALTFCNCMKNTEGVKAIYSTWMQKEHNGIDLCTNKEHGGSQPEDHGHSTSGGAEHISFNDYLHNQNAALDREMQCCTGKARGLFDKTGKAIVSAWTANTSLMRDAAASAAVVSSINKCATSQDSCSVHDFMHCAMEGCYAALKAN